MPALAQTKPWLVSVISTPRSARSTSRLSSRISSHQRRLLAEHCGELGAPRRPGCTEESRRTRPSALETTFCEIDDDVAVARARRARRSARRAFVPWPRSRAGPSTGIDPQRACALISPAPSRSAAPGRGRVASSRVRAIDVGGGVEVERQRGQLLDREGDAGLARGGDVALAAALAEGGPDRVRRARAPGRWCRCRGGRGRSRRSARARRSAGGRARAGRAAGSRRASRTTQLGARGLRRGRSRPAPPRSGRRRSGSGDHLGAGRGRELRALGLAADDDRPLDRARRRRSPPARPRASPRPVARGARRRCPAASRCLAAPKRFTGRTAVAFKPSTRALAA